jgi:hypothetical protein
MFYMLLGSECQLQLKITCLIFLRIDCLGSLVGGLLFLGIVASDCA